MKPREEVFCDKETEINFSAWRYLSVNSDTTSFSVEPDEEPDTRLIDESVAPYDGDHSLRDA